MAAGLGSATVNVLANTANFENSLRRSFKRIGAATAGIAVGVGVTNFLSGAIKNSITLENQLAKIKTILDNPADLQAFFDVKTVRDFSNEVGLSTKAVTDAAYLAVSSGVKAKDALSTVRAAAQLAIATTSDLTTVVDATTSSVNAFGDNGVDAAHATDVLFKALQYGKGTMNDFAKYVSTAIPIADSLGVSLEQVAGTGATLTLTGMSSRKAFTGMKVAMQELANETKGGGKEFKRVMGEDFQSYIKRTGNLQKAFTDFTAKVGANNLTKIFGAKEGAAALQTLSTIGDDTYASIIKGTENAAGAAAAAFATVDATTSRQIEHLKTEWSNYKGIIGDALGPGTATFIKGARDLLGGLADKTQRFIWQAERGFPAVKRALDGTSKAAGFLRGMWAQLAPGVTRFVNALKGTVPAVGELLGVIASLAPILGVVAAAAGVVAAVFAGAVMGALTTVMSVFNAFAGFLSQHKDLVFAVAAALTAFTLVLAANTIAVNLAWAAYVLYAIVVNGVATALGLLRDAMILLDAVPGPLMVVAVLAALAVGLVVAWKKSETFRKIVVGVFNAIVTAVAAAAKFMISAYGKFVDFILMAWQKLLEGLGKLPDWLGGGVFDAAADGLQRLRNGVANAVTDINNKIDSIRDKVTVELDIVTRHFNDQDGTLGNINKQLSDVNSEKAAAAAFHAKNGAFSAPKDYNVSTTDLDPSYYKKTGTKKTPADTPGGGTGGSTKKAADTAAKQAASAIKAALKKVGGDLNRLAKFTAKQTIDQIHENFKTLYTDLAAGARKDLIPSVKKLEATLVALAARRDAVNDKLNGKDGVEGAIDKLKRLKEQSKDFIQTIKEGYTDLGKVTSNSDPLTTTIGGITNHLRKAIFEGTQFKAFIDKLKTMKLNDTSLRQIIDAGPEQGLAAARALVAGGQQAITGPGGVNALQTSLEALGNKASTAANGMFYQNGVDMAQTLVDGLQSQASALEKAMEKIGDRMAAAWVSKLSPKSLAALLNKISATSVPVPKGTVQKGGTTKTATGASVDVHITGPVGDIAAAKQIGKAAGSAIHDTLTRKRNSAALAGTA